MEDRSWVSPLRSLLFTDLYELAMARAYEAEGMDRPAVFELFFRELPPVRNYLVAAGLDDVLASLQALGVTEEDRDYLRTLGRFPEPFLERLCDFRFSGEVWAVPEGTVVFPHEPLVQVVAPILEAQLIETLVLNQVHFQVVAASKAARVVAAAAGRDVIEFGSRRAHGAEAALKVARASYLAGAAGTSNVLAGELYGIPVFGTMAHSYIQAHDDEAAAFEAFAGLYPETTLLVDTYDTLGGVRKVIELARRLGDRFRVRAVRLDSGDLGALAVQARKMLDAAGLSAVRIFAVRRAGRARGGGARRGEGAHRRLRRRHEDGRERGRPFSRHGLQAGRVRGPAADEAVDEEGPLPRPQAGLPRRRGRPDGAGRDRPP